MELVDKDLDCPAGRQLLSQQRLETQQRSQQKIRKITGLSAVRQEGMRRCLQSLPAKKQALEKLRIKP